VFPSSRFYKQDITEPQIEQNEKCCVVLGDTPGVGFEPVPQRLDAVTLYQQTFER